VAKKRSLEQVVQPLIDKAVASQVAKAIGLARKLGGVVATGIDLATNPDTTSTNGLQVGAKAVAASGIPGVSQVAAIVSQVIAIVEAREEKVRERLERELREQINQRLAEADTAKRYQEDVQFQRQINAEARETYLGKVASGWHPRTSRLNDGDF
jgi:BMFP domain-containing protein YqiC